MSETEAKKSISASAKIATVLVSLVIVAQLVEVGMRMFGLPAAWQQPRHEPTLHEFDEQLGWRNKPGSYVIPPYSPGQAPIRMTFLADGTRRSGEGSGGETPLLLVGGSVAQGFAISDEETLAWKLQERFPRSAVRNFGCAGYASYQSLLVLERELPRTAPGAVVVYAFTGHHTTRNVAPWHWKRALSRMSARGHVDVPYVSVEPGRSLRRHPPERWVDWPLAQHSRLVAFIQARLTKLREASPKEVAIAEQAVIENILPTMDELAEARQANFAVAILSSEQAKGQWLHAFLDSRGVPVVDCNAYPLRRNQTVIGEGHPNGRMNDTWTQCVGEFLERRFRNSLLSTGDAGA